MGYRQLWRRMGMDVNIKGVIKDTFVEDLICSAWL